MYFLIVLIPVISFVLWKFLLAHRTSTSVYVLTNVDADRRQQAVGAYSSMDTLLRLNRDIFLGFLEDDEDINNPLERYDDLVVTPLVDEGYLGLNNCTFFVESFPIDSVADL